MKVDVSRVNGRQNSRALRRLAADHGALHSQPLPPNYLFPPAGSNNDDLTQLDILLAGPTHTPFSAGVWKLHLTIPTTYPQQPPTANFRTAIFHPNVDPQTGGVCVETLKRDWDSKLTLRDVLVTISCLLIQPNPDSALNAEAGALIQDDYRAFSQRAELMTSIQAAIPQVLREAAQEAQDRGQERGVKTTEDEMRDVREKQPEAPVRARRATARQRGGGTSRRSDGSPTGGAVRRRHRQPAGNPFVVQAGNDDVFGGSSRSGPEATRIHEDDDSSMVDENQENDEARSPVKAPTPKVAAPRRPQGAPVPLGELTLDDIASDSNDESEEAEYPPSPRKSPVKRRQQHSNSNETASRAESSNTAAARARNLTPQNNPQLKPPAENSPFVDSSFMEPHHSLSPCKQKNNLFTPGPARKPLFPSLHTPKHDGGVFKPRSPSSAEKKREEARRRVELEAKLWEMCGKNVGRWNRGDFDGEPFNIKAKRW
ncbi:uncharacterized protein LTR77_006601 [Saxophila tyrrhenica]|uniref:UBC core domain-containing protein n=1 Tax=Saxophila tyrrhenica TaxID=1690608 RepID=A0AAV9P5T0_9PEZI|nr:hypothetical protein LTR77_006601 [Saxophila tyrrhenica]